MEFECENDPNDLIEQIGDPNFSICDDSWDEVYRHPRHPLYLRIIDCENGTQIDVSGEDEQDSFIIATNLVKLLNQDYRKNR